MSAFKFACPVCGQHITADSTSSGTHLECPTCFRKIVVPQAPASKDPKFILSAAQAAKPRPGQGETKSDLGPIQPQPQRPRSLVPVLVAAAVLVCGVGAATYLLRGKIHRRHPEPKARVTKRVAPQRAAPAPPKPVAHPIPTNFFWTLDLTNAVIPEATVAGRIHGEGFLCERAALMGGTLQLRQGSGRSADLGIAIQFVAQQGEELSGKTVEIAPDGEPPLPHVTLRWRDDEGNSATKSIHRGYALKVSFGEASNGRLPGKLYIALPDEAKSFVAGAFTASIRKPPKSDRKKF